MMSCSIEDMAGDESVHYGKFLRWIFAPASNSESGHQADVFSHLARIDAELLPETAKVVTISG